MSFEECHYLTTTMINRASKERLNQLREERTYQVHFATVGLFSGALGILQLLASSLVQSQVKGKENWQIHVHQIQKSCICQQGCVQQMTTSAFLSALDHHDGQNTPSIEFPWWRSELIQKLLNSLV